MNQQRLTRFVRLVILLSFSACVSKKQYLNLQTSMEEQLAVANKQLGECGLQLNQYMGQVNACEQEKVRLKGEINSLQQALSLRQEQIDDLKLQRDKQLNSVQDLTGLSKTANDNIRETLSQLEQKDKYIRLLQAAKTKADSINLALAVNLKGVLKEGLDDTDVEVKVDKTVVFVNLSDKMLYQSGSSSLTPKAMTVLGKIAQILESRPDLEVMVEGYTDNVPIKNNCLDDNWDLSVKRATSVVRVLQTSYKIDPNRLIAAGRGEYNALVPNTTPENRSTNRRTRIIILPKLDQFYDLLNPESAKN